VGKNGDTNIETNSEILVSKVKPNEENRSWTIHFKPIYDKNRALPSVHHLRRLLFGPPYISLGLQKLQN